MKKIVSLIIVLIAAGAAFFLLTRKAGPEQQLVGTWYDSKTEQVIVFNKDKSLEMTNKQEETRTGTWKIIGKKVKLELTSAADASGELPEGDISSIYLKFDGLNEDNFYTFSATFEKQE